MIAACPTEQRLRAFSLGQLDEEQSDLLFTHVSDCVECQHVLAESNPDDTLTGHLKDTRADGPDFAGEDECRVAMTRAMTVLADIHSNGEFAEQKLPGKIGDYEIVRMIGRGGMGHVYLARHAQLGKQVALKVIARHRAADPKMQGRFEAELRALGQLNHPNIVTALDAREENGVVVLVTEFIDGLDLTEIVRRTGPLNPADAARVVYQVADALTAINKQNMVHRDIKPSNIMISNDGKVKLLDLGLARLQGDGANREFTMTGQAIGTVDYLAPEQINGIDPVDIRADIYSLGCTLFKLLTGEVPFHGPDYTTTFAKMTAHVTAPRPTIHQPDVPGSLVSLTKQMMSVKREGRPDQPAKVMDAVEKLADRSDLRALIIKALATDPALAASSTIGQNDVESKLATETWWRRPVPVATAGACGFFGILLGFLFGVIITIKKPDGTTATMEVPDGSRVTIDAEGNAEVSLRQDDGANTGETSPSDRAISPESTTRAKAMEALRGIWKLQVNRPVESKLPDQPNLIVFGRQNHVAVFRDNVLLARGTASFPEAMSSSMFIQLDVVAPAIERWLPKSFVCRMITSQTDPDEVLLSGILVHSQDKEGDGNSRSGLAGSSSQLRQYYLKRVSIPGEIADFPELIVQGSFLQRNSTCLAAMRSLYNNDRFVNKLSSPSTEVLETFERQMSKYNMRLLVVAMHNYADIFREGSRPLLPASRNTRDLSARYAAFLLKRLDANPNPGNMDETDGFIETEGAPSQTDHPYSWRVAILPFLGHGDLYAQYRFDEPWNSEQNRKLLDKMPQVFRYPADPENTTNTRYVGVTGSHSAMGMDEGVGLEEISDGTSQTILLVEGRDPVPWTKPQDIVFDPNHPERTPRAGWFVGAVSNVVFADSSAKTMALADIADLQSVRAFLTSRGGENARIQSSSLFKD